MPITTPCALAAPHVGALAARPPAAGEAPPGNAESPLTLAAAIVCIVLVAVDLRPGIVSVGPTLEQIRSEFGMSNTQASLLTVIPNVLMGLLALPTPWLARRFGRNRVILAALAVLAAATLLRALVGNTALLLVTTAGVGAGIAVAGALVAGFVKARFPRQVSLLMGLYAMSLGLGSTLAAAMTGPMASSGGGWRLGTGVWALPGLTAIAAWLYVAASEPARPPAATLARAATRATHPARSAKAWFVALYFATNNFLFFGLLSWLAPLFRELGTSQVAPGVVLASFTTAFMLANPMPSIVSRTADRRATVALFAGIALLGLCILAAAPGYLPLVTIPVIACGIGGSFALGMTLPLDHATNDDGANAWTSFTLSVGYSLGALGPLTLGLLRDMTGNFQLALWALVLVGGLKLALAPFLAPATAR